MMKGETQLSPQVSCTKELLKAIFITMHVLCCILSIPLIQSIDPVPCFMSQWRAMCISFCLDFFIVLKKAVLGHSHQTKVLAPSAGYGGHYNNFHIPS